MDFDDPGNPDTVHPRVCGEHRFPRLSVYVPGGSSPRMRGTPDLHSTVRHWCRFIPAYAGNTAHQNNHDILTAVHPRVCGEHPDGSIGFTRFYGSSPRMRGTPVPRAYRFSGPRFIPAYAGNTNTTPMASNANPVHPRVCGEHLAGIYPAVSVIGSSPRMRGTLMHEQGGSNHGRFIPAYAGNTYKQMDQTAAGAVHPRVCGEHD